MAIIQSLGLGSGVLKPELVDKIINAEKKDAEQRIKEQQGLVKARITAYGELKSRMSKFQDAIKKLANPEIAGALKASSSSEDLLTVDIDPKAARQGTHNVQVNNIAKAHSIATKRYASEYSTVGEGRLVFSFGKNNYDANGALTSQTPNGKRGGQTIIINSTNNTLAGIRDAINNTKTGIKGVTASVVNDGSGFRLSIRSDETGEENGMRIQAQDNTGNALTTATGLGALNFNENQQGGSFIQQNSKGEDAKLAINGLSISRSSNEIKDVIGGVTLNLKSADVGKQVQVEVKADAEKLSKAIQELVDTHNKVKEVLDDVTQYDTKSKKSGLLMGDSLIKDIKSRIASMISLPIKGLEGQKYNSLASLGVKSVKSGKNYELEFSKSVFNKALANNRRNVSNILSESGRTSDSQVKFMNSSLGSKPGTYSIEVTKMAKRASFTTNSVAQLNFASPLSINSTNDNFSINVDGKGVLVSLRHGQFTSGADFAEHLTQQINGALSGTGKGVTVAYNSADNNFTFTSNAYGSGSQISFMSLDSASSNTLGFNTTGQGAYLGSDLSSLGSKAMAGKGASTQIGTQSFGNNPVSHLGVNFALTNANFSLSIDGQPAVNVTVNQNAKQDLNADGTIDVKDGLQAVQNAIDATSLNGKVQASLDKNGYLVFNTTAVGSARSIEITSVGNSSTDQLLGLDATQGVQTNGKNAGITLASAAEFKVKVDGVESTTNVSIAAGTYNTGQDMASAIQAQLAAKLSGDVAFAGKTAGASTDTGDRDISSAIDFAANPSGFVLNVNGVEKEVVINAGAANNITSIQTALDTQFGAGVVTASLDGAGLKLTTNATGHDKFIEVKSDGRGARTTAGADMSTGIDFSGAANEATFTLSVGGKDVNVVVNQDASAGGAQANLLAVQNALNSALSASPDFAVGDIQAKLDENNKIYFETSSQNRVKTASSFGKSASIEVKNLGGTASSKLGLVVETKSNGYDVLGINSNRKYGYDLTPEVTYKADPSGETGRFEIKIGGNTTNVRFNDLNTSAITALGLQDEANYRPEVAKGQDVEGKINGVDATGKGQYLRAVDGNVKASNGFYIAGESTVSQTNPLTMTASNNKFKIKIDGEEQEIALAVGTTFSNGKNLASAIQSAINENAAYKAKGIKVKVEYTDDPKAFAHKKLSIISGSTGSKSVVEITDISSAASTAFGFDKGIGDGKKGVDQVGEPDDSSGIRVQILGGSTGNRGTVTYVSGFADQLQKTLKGFLNGSRGLINRSEANLKAQQERLTKESTILTERMEKKAEDLRSKFLYNDKLVSKLNSTLEYLKQQFAAMNGVKK